MGELGEDADRPEGHESQRQRVLTSALAGIAAGTVAAFLGPWQLAVLVGWDVVALVVIVRVWTRVGRFTPEQTRANATREDDSRASAELLLVGASLASLGGAAMALGEANQTDSTTGTVLTVLAVLTVALSWTVVHTVFALRYAHEYFRPGEGEAIDFKHVGYRPDYGDFAYLAFTVGMTFQVSDTDVRSRLIRGTILRHALISYLFGAIIVAVTVNVIAGLLN